MSLKKLITLFTAAALVLSLTACAEAPDPEADLKSMTYVDSMDTFMTLTAYGSNREAALEEASREVMRLNDIFSIGVDTSEIYTANHVGSTSLSPDTLTVIQRAAEVNDMTNGCFDITVTPLMELWGFTNKNYKVPSTAEIDTTLSRTGPDKITVDAEGKTLSLSDNAEIDLGGIAKGYTSQRIMEIFKENGVKSGIVSLGGNVQCLGLKPDGSKWRVAIREPWASESTFALILEIEDCAVISSGGYERYFEQDGKIYCHILDPKTGYPVESDLDSVSIICKDGTLADGLSTALFIMGYDRAVEFWKENSSLFELVLIKTDGEIFVTPNLSESASSGKEIHIIE